MTIVDLLIISIAVFSITHFHVRMVKIYGIKLYVPEYEYCYHCISFWYALIVTLFFPEVLTLSVAIAGMVLIFREYREKF